MNWKRNYMDLIDVIRTLPETKPLILEYRVYYDDNGKIITYTTDKLEGKYIVIDRQTYALADHTMIVVNNKLISTKKNKMSTKFKKSDKGIKCSKYDINIIVDNDDEYNSWELVVNGY